jgi:hypothetical protein
MESKKVVDAAVDFLRSKGIQFSGDGVVSTVGDGFVEVVFEVPQALDPDVVVDPPDVRVCIDLQTMLVRLIDQM